MVHNVGLLLPNHLDKLSHAYDLYKRGNTEESCKLQKSEFCCDVKIKFIGVTNVLQGSLDVLEGPRVEELSPAGSYQLPVCCLCAGVRE